MLGRVGGGRADARTLGAFSLAVALPSSSQTVLIPVIPALADEQGWSEASSTWLVSSFLVVASISAPLMGRIGDMAGRRRLIIATGLMYLCGSALCLAGSSSLSVLVVGRMLQGSAAGIFVLQIATIQELSGYARRGLSIGLLSGVVGIGPAVGFLVGGALSEWFGVDSVFVAGIVLSIASTVLLWLWTPRSGGMATGGIDVAGAGLLASWFTLVLLWLSTAGDYGWLSLWSASLAGGAVLLIVSWLAVQLTRAYPLIDLRMMRTPAVGWGTAATVANGCAIFSLFLAVPQLVQAESGVHSGPGFNLGPVGTGLVLAPGAVTLVVAGLISGWLGSRLGPRVPAVIGSLISTVGLGSLATFHSSLVGIIAWVIVISVGFGMTFPALPVLVMNAVDRSHVGAAAGLNSLARGFGSAVGAQAAPVLISLGTDEIPRYGYAFAAGAVFSLLTAVLLVSYVAVVEGAN